jgi:quinol monooxygenase YgiN
MQISERANNEGVVGMGELNEVVLIAEAAALPGKRDELRRAFDELVPRALAEAGVRTFRLHEDRDQSGHFMLYERYHDQDAVDAHFETEHFAAIVNALAEFAEGGKARIVSYHLVSD